MKVHRKGNKLVVISHIADKNLEHKREKLKEQAKRIVHPRKIYGEQGKSDSITVWLLACRIITVSPHMLIMIVLP